MIIYTIYIIKINNIKIGVTRNINTNGIATILLLFSNSSLVIWLYELAYAILSEKKMTWYGIMSGIIYNIPGIVISGRDALMIFFVSTIIVLFYCGYYGKKVLGLEGKMYKKILRFLGICLLLMMFYLIFLSNSRYGSSQEATIQMFKWSTDCQFPEYLENIYYKGGKVGSLILNIIFYYSSQLSKFSLIFEKYNGPYLFGFYQLHYISRLLPDFMGMNFTNVTNAIQQIASNAGTPGIKSILGNSYRIFNLRFWKNWNTIYFITWRNVSRKNKYFGQTKGGNNININTSFYMYCYVFNS